jgi:hypothetical protein
LGQEIRGIKSGRRKDACFQTYSLPGAVAQSAAAVQLDRSSAGTG